jgi:hypothetical protein
MILATRLFWRIFPSSIAIVFFIFFVKSCTYTWKMKKNKWKIFNHYQNNFSLNTDLTFEALKKQSKSVKLLHCWVTIKSACYKARRLEHDEPRPDYPVLFPDHALYVCSGMYRSFSFWRKWRQLVPVNSMTPCPGMTWWMNYVLLDSLRLTAVIRDKNYHRHHHHHDPWPLINAKLSKTYIPYQHI